VHSPFDLLALLLVISAGLAYLNHRVLKLPLTVGLLVGAAAGALLLVALDAVLPGLGLRLAIRGVVGSINFPATLLDGFLAFLLFAGALQVNSADMFARKWTILALVVKIRRMSPADLADFRASGRTKVGTKRQILSTSLFRYDTLGRIGRRSTACRFAVARARYFVSLVSCIRRFDLAHRPGLGPRCAKADWYSPGPSGDRRGGEPV
jgi:hypothetical protein